MRTAAEKKDKFLRQQAWRHNELSAQRKENDIIRARAHQQQLNESRRVIDGMTQAEREKNYDRFKCDEKALVRLKKAFAAKMAAMIANHKARMKKKKKF